MDIEKLQNKMDGKMDRKMDNIMGENNDNVRDNMSNKLVNIMQNLSFDIVLNNRMIKEKIRRKIDIIMNMKFNCFSVMNYDNITCENILERLKQYYNGKQFLIYNDELNKLLGSILHNIYEYSGYQILLYNIPEYGIAKYDDNLMRIDSEVIYDTLKEFIDINDIISVFRVSVNSYIAKIKDDNKAKDICNLLNNKIIGNNIMKVEYIANVKNNLTDINNKSIISNKCDNFNKANKYDINSIDGVDNDIILNQETSKINTNLLLSFLSYLYINIKNGFNYINFLLSSKIKKQ